MVVTVLTAVFPVYFGTVAAVDLPDGVASGRYSMVTAIALTVVAVLAPILGALADTRPLKKRLLATFAALGMLSSAALVAVGPGDWQLGLVLFALANIGAACSFVFYDALLPHVARSPTEQDRLSTTAYALGYLGGGLVLAVNLLMIERPAWFGIANAEWGSRLSFLCVALWWALFTIPLLRRVPEPPIAPVVRAATRPVREAVRQLRQTFHDLRGYRHAFLMLVAFLIYNDGIQTVFRMATIYGAELHIGTQHLIGAILLVQFIGVPFAFLFGALAARFGAKRCILFCVAVYVVVCVFAYRMSTTWEFYALAVAVGTVQGGAQALSRSLFASLIPRQRSGEFFGFFAVGERFAGIFGPFLFSVAQMTTGSSRLAILSIVVFFVIGGFLLVGVDVDQGRDHARREELLEGAV